MKQVYGMQTILQDLAEQYHIRDEQKQEMMSVVVGELPNVAVIAMGLLKNRQSILSLNTVSDDYDAQEMERLATSQGELVTKIILWKESLKQQLRLVLDDDQKTFVNDFIQQFIASRILAIIENQPEVSDIQGMIL